MMIRDTCLLFMRHPV